jgi:hypothetical protein
MLSFSRSGTENRTGMLYFKDKTKLCEKVFNIKKNDQTTVNLPHH